MYRHHYRSNRTRHEQQQRNLKCLEFITILCGEIGLDSMSVNVWDYLSGIVQDKAPSLNNTSSIFLRIVYRPC